MSAISLKSITGITSITTPAGVDNVFTVHTNDTVERFRVDSTGNLNIAGIVTVTGRIDASDNIAITSGNRLYFGNSDVAFIKGEHGGSGYLALGANSEHVRITRAGKVGIGTDNPSTILHLRDNSNDCDLTIQATASGKDARLNLYGNSGGVSQIRFGDEADTNVGLITYDHSDNSLQLRAGDYERLRIHSDGKIGIGLAGGTPDGLLEVYNSSTAGNTVLKIHNDKNDDAANLTLEGKRTSDNDTGQVLFKNNNYAVAAIFANAGGSGNHDGGYLKFLTSAVGSGNVVTERLRIDSSGRVMIGGGSSPTQVGDGRLIVYASERLHPAIKADCLVGGSNAANGFTLLADNYQADESICNFGISYSGAGLVISRGVKVSNAADNVYLSSTDTAAQKPSAFKLDNGGNFTFLNTNTSAQTTTDSAVSLTERLRITSDGALGIGNLQTAQGISVTHTSKTKFYLDSTKFTKIARLAAGNISSAGWFTVAKIASSNGNYFKCYASIGGDFCQDMCVMELTGSWSASGGLSNAYAEPVFKAHRVGAHSTERITRARFVKDSSNVTYLQIYIASGHSSYWGKSVLEYTMGTYAQNIADSGSAAMFEAGGSVTGIRTLEVDDNAICVNAGSHKFYSGGNATERLTITSGGSVLIDTTVTTEASGDFDDLIIGSTSDTNKGISIVGSTTNGIGSLTFTDGASYKNQGIIQYRHADDSMRFHTNQYERLRIDSSGHLHTGYTSGFGGDHVNIFASDGGGISISAIDISSAAASSGDLLGSYSFQGYHNSATHLNAEAKISAIAAANHTGSSAATDMVFYTKPSTTGPGSAPTERLRITKDGHVIPGADNTYDLGSSTNRWKDLYVGDAHFSNRDSSNEVDGTWGDWTLQEGESKIFMINNRTGKKYSLVMEEE